MLRVWLEAWAAWAGRGGCPGNLVFNSKFPQPHAVRLGWVGVGLAEGLYRLQLSGKGAAGQQPAPGGFETAQISQRALAQPLSYRGLGAQGNTRVKRTGASV